MGEKLLVGKITNTQGLKGHVKIFPYTTEKEEFEDFKALMIEGEGNARFEIDAIRYQKNMVIVLFEGLQSINDVEKLKNKEVYVLRSDLGDMDEDTFMYSEVAGYDVVDSHHGKVGVLVKVETGAVHELLVVERENGDTFMVPCVKAFVDGFDHGTRTVKVSLIEGMME